MIEDNKWYKRFKARPWLLPVVFVAGVLVIAGITALVGLIF